MKNIVNELIKTMELNNYNFKIENGWDDTITLVLIGEEEDIFHITIDFNIELEKIFIFEVYNNNVELISKHNLNDFTTVTDFIETFYEYN